MTAPSPQPPTEALLLNLKAVTRMVGMSRASVYRMLAAREFPPPRRVGGRRVTRWFKQDVVEWCARQPKDRR